MPNAYKSSVDVQGSLQSVDGLDDIFNLIVNMAADLGFDNVAYGCFSGELELEDLAPAVRLNYPDAWVDRYFNEGFFEIDPVVTNIMNAGRITLWSNLARTKQEKDFISLASDHGLKHGLSVPLVGPNGGAYVFSFASLDDIRATQARECLMLAQLAHARLLETVDAMAPGGDGSALTDQQKVILKALADGETIGAVAGNLGMTKDGINYHLKAIRRALGTKNLPHSVAVAVRQDII